MSTMSFKDQMKNAQRKGEPQNDADSDSWEYPYRYKGNQQSSFPGLAAQAKPITVHVLDEEKSEVWRQFEVPSMYSEWLPIALKWFPPGPEERSVLVPKKLCSFSADAPSFNACTHNATDEYLQARWGRKLHHTDKDWLAAHPYATDDGIPTEYTLVCLQELLEPYGMGVSAVRMRRGSLAAAAQVMQFANALGVNPLGLVDHQTGNEEAAKKLGIDPVEAAKLWRFEFSERPLTGCTIVCERGVSDGGDVKTGFAGGHARYLSPRQYAFNWVLSFQLAPLETIAYQAPITYPEYIARTGPQKLVLSSILRPDGSLPIARMSGNWYKPVDICGLCGKHDEPLEEGGTCCERCHGEAWAKYRCGECKTTFTKSWNPTFLERNAEAGFAKFECPSRTCNATFAVYDDDQDKALVKVAHAYPDTVTH